MKIEDQQAIGQFGAAVMRRNNQESFLNYFISD